MFMVPGEIIAREDSVNRGSRYLQTSSGFSRVSFFDLHGIEYDLNLNLFERDQEMLIEICKLAPHVF